MNTKIHHKIIHDNTFHIAFGVDENYLRGTGTSISSVIENNHGIYFIFHVFCFSISDKDREKLLSINTGINAEIVIHIIDQAMFDGLDHLGASFHFSTRSALIRFVIPLTLRSSTKRVLYLDSDIICTNDIKELMSIDMNGVTAAAVQDMGNDPLVDMQCHLFNIDRKNYFNAGFLYVNIEEWITNNISATSMDIIFHNNGELIYPDQDTLNIALKGKTIIIDRKWNFQFNTEMALKQGDTEFSPQPHGALIHFVGRLKPWHNWNMHDSRFLYLRYEEKSPWSGTLLDPPKNVEDMHAFSLILFRHWHVTQGLKWYFKHWLIRLAPSHPNASHIRWKKIKRRMRLFHKNQLQRQEACPPVQNRMRDSLTAK